MRSNDLNKSKEVLLKSISEHYTAKQSHLKLAKIYLEYGTDPEKKLVAQHLRSAFSDGDSNYEAQFWYAREMFLIGNLTESKRYFEQLKNANLSLDVKNKVKGVVLENKQHKKYFGKIVSMEDNYLFVRSSSLPQDVYSSFRYTDLEIWQDLNYSDDVSFSLGFTYKGATAIEVRRLFVNK